MTAAPSPAMPLAEGIGVLHAARREEVVVTTMGCAREWMRLGSHPLDLVYVPSSMGQATSVGLGLALAQPDRRVVVCNGDGSMLMNLGSLVTITSQRPKNLIVLLFDNGVYEVTGAQDTPGSAALRGGRAVDFAQMARTCGFESVFEFSDLEAWASQVHEVLNAEGPVFGCLHAQPVYENATPKSPGPAWERARALREALG